MLERRPIYKSYVKKNDFGRICGAIEEEEIQIADLSLFEIICYKLLKTPAYEIQLKQLLFSSVSLEK